MRRSAQSIVLAAIVMAAGAAMAESPAAKQADEEKAVLAAMDRFMIAISTGDVEGLRKLFTPEGVTHRALVKKDGPPEVVARPQAYWSDPARFEGRTLHERYWSPTLLLRDPIAVVWAPYEFKIDGKTTHCGIDVFDFVKIDGEWRIASAMWTVEPDACAELRPADTSKIRPKG
ncbi:MAG: hypothetical protein WC538_21930 [Thermoanaerobaculia bacterium]